MISGEPFEILSVNHLHVGRGSASIQTKMRNLKTGQVFERNYKSSDEFKEADIEKQWVVFIYESKGMYWFHEKGDPGKRFSLSSDVLGDRAMFVKPKMEVTAVFLIKASEEKEVVSIELPIKENYVVTEAPPTVRGNTAQGGNKQVTIEGGATVTAPLFVNTGDIIRVNTETGEYVERIEKAS